MMASCHFLALLMSNCFFPKEGKINLLNLAIVRNNCVFMRQIFWGGLIYNFFLFLENAAPHKALLFVDLIYLPFKFLENEFTIHSNWVAVVNFWW